MHLGDILTEVAMYFHVNHTAFEMGNGNWCTFCMFYQFGQLSINRGQQLPNSFHEVQFSTLSIKYVFVQVGICMFTEEFHFVRI